MHLFDDCSIRRVKLSKPIWFAKHYLNSAGDKESHRHAAEEITKKSECEFDLESLSSSHYDENVFKLFFHCRFLSDQCLMFLCDVASAVFCLGWSVRLLKLLFVEQHRCSRYIYFLVYTYTKYIHIIYTYYAYISYIIYISYIACLI